MDVNSILLSINARDFYAQSKSWASYIGRQHDRAPMPSCHEWDLTADVLFQVLDSGDGRAPTTVTIHVPDLDSAIQRLAKVKIVVPAPVDVMGFKSLRYAEFYDPEGNKVGLLDGN